MVTESNYVVVGIEFAEHGRIRPDDGKNSKSALPGLRTRTSGSVIWFPLKPNATYTHPFAEKCAWRE